MKKSTECSLPTELVTLGSETTAEAARPGTAALRAEFKRVVARIKAQRAHHQARADDLSAPEKAKRILAQKYFGYRFADEKNKKYGLNDSVGGRRAADPRDVRSSWAYIHMPKNARKYSAAELSRIEARVAAAARKCGVKLNVKDRARAAAGGFLSADSTRLGAHAAAQPAPTALAATMRALAPIFPGAAGATLRKMAAAYHRSQG